MKTHKQLVNEYALALYDIATLLQLEWGSTSAEIVEAVRARLNPPKPEPKQFPSGFTKGEEVRVDWKDDCAPAIGFGWTSQDRSYYGPAIFRDEFKFNPDADQESMATVFIKEDNECATFPISAISKIKPEQL